MSSGLPFAERESQLSLIRAAAGRGAGILSAFTPALAAVLKPSASSQASVAGADQFTLAVVDLLLNLARAAGGLLLCVDEVEWLDDSSRRVLSQLASRLPEAPVMVLATAHHESEGTRSTDPALDVVGISPELDVTLGPLDDTAMTELMRA